MPDNLDMNLRYTRTQAHKAKVCISDDAYDEMKILKGLRSRKLEISQSEGLIFCVKDGCSVANIRCRVSDGKPKDARFHIPIDWPKPKSFWGYFLRADGRGFLMNSFMIIALVSFFTANLVFKGDIYGVMYLALAASPFITWMFLRTVYKNIKYNKGGEET